MTTPVRRLAKPFSHLPSPIPTPGRTHSMNTEALRSLVLNPLKERFEVDASSRISTTYFDFTGLVLLAKQVARGTNDMTPFDLKPEARATWQSSHAKTIVLVKAAFVFADIFFGAFCAEVFGRRVRGPGLKGRINATPALWAMPAEVLAAAYAASQFRNSLIAHHDFSRVPGSMIRAREIRLCPIGQSPLTEADKSKVDALWAKYRPGTASNLPVRNMITPLFHEIPAVSDGNRNPDRQDIDRLADRFGCDSMTLDELVVAVDKFAVEVASLPGLGKHLSD